VHTIEYEEHSDEDTIRERACSNDAIIMDIQIVSDSERANEVRSALARSEEHSDDRTIYEHRDIYVEVASICETIILEQSSAQTSPNQPKRSFIDAKNMAL
jgi:hypothetical protein